MGAAGLTCSSSEMGARAGTGIRIDIAKVPKRETGMTAYEVMLSESQERMLLVAEKGREAEVVRVFEKWDLHAEPIGAVTDDGRLRVFDGEGLEARLLHGAPLVGDGDREHVVAGGCRGCDAEHRGREFPRGA